MKNKSININQRIPLDTLYTGIISFLNESYSEEYILEQLRLEFKGENRLKKSVRIVNKIIQNNPLKETILAHKTEIEQAIKKKNDRNLILIALLSSAFVFSFDLLRILGKYLSVQDFVNRETLKKALGNIYGGNRATDNAIDSIIPMFLEADIIIRPSLGIYHMNKNFQISSSITKSLFIESFKENTNLIELQDYHYRDPYFFILSF